MNLKKGLLRASVVLSPIVFLLGFFLEFSPLGYLYSKTDFHELATQIKTEKYSSGCKGGRITLVLYFTDRTKYSFTVNQQNPETGKYSEGNCPFLVKYAELLGRDVVFERKIQVDDLTHERIDDDIDAARKRAQLVEYKERTFNGAKFVLYVWLTFIGLYFFHYSTNWVVKGFRS